MQNKLSVGFYRVFFPPNGLLHWIKRSKPVRVLNLKTHFTIKLISHWILPNEVVLNCDVQNELLIHNSCHSSNRLQLPSVNKLSVRCCSSSSHIPITVRMSSWSLIRPFLIISDWCTESETVCCVQHSNRQSLIIVTNLTRELNLVAVLMRALQRCILMVLYATKIKKSGLIQ